MLGDTLFFNTLLTFIFLLNETNVGLTILSETHF